MHLCNVFIEGLYGKMLGHEPLRTSVSFGPARGFDHTLDILYQSVFSCGTIEEGAREDHVR